MKKLILLGTFALLAVFFSCQKDSLSVMNNAPQGFFGATEYRDSTALCDTTHNHHHDSLHIHHDSLHIHHDSLHVHDSLHIHHDSTHIDTSGHHGGNHGGGHGGNHGGGHGGNHGGNHGG